MGQHERAGAIDPPHAPRRSSPRRLALLLITLLLALPASAAAAHVYVVIVDGLDARLATPAHMPRLFATLASAPARSSVLAARAVMPARTNPNHVTLLTGTWPEAHGITGNAFWSRARAEPARKLDVAALIEVETLFSVAEETSPALVTMGVFGKPKLARLFAAVPGRQRAPDVLWSPSTAPRLVK